MTGQVGTRQVGTAMRLKRVIDPAGVSVICALDHGMTSPTFLEPLAGIAAALVVSVGVVEKHVASIFDKLRLPPAEGDNRRVLAVLRFLRA
jgi:hypothetical protein